MAFAFAAETARDATYDACTSTAATASCSSTTSSSTTGGRGAGPGCGASPATAYRRAARPRRVRTGRPDDGLRPGRPSRGRSATRWRVPRRAPHARARGRRCTATGVSHDDEFARALAERDWIAPGLGPRRRRAAGLDPFDVHVLDEELTGPSAPTYLLGTTEMVARVIEPVGTDELKDDDRPGRSCGRAHIALGMTEPEAGSDVAGGADPGPPRRRRVGHRRPEDVHDQRPRRRLRVPAGPHRTPTCPSTRASPCSSCRSTSPGVEVQAVYTLSGERTNITFYNDVARRRPLAHRRGRRRLGAR